MMPLSTEPLSDEEFDWLNDFLLDRLDDDTDTEGLDEGILDMSELDGLLTAVVSGPVMIPPSQWIPQVWGDFEPVWDNEQAAKQAMSLLMRHMNDIAAMLMEQPEDFQPLFLERVVDDETHTIVDEWCEGYMRGVALAAGQWDLQNIEIKILIAPIKAFQGEQAFTTHDQFSPQEIHNLQQAITPNVRGIHAYWLARRADHAPSTPIKHAEPKTGRNDPCPCGSGKKYKKCCLH